MCAPACKCTCTFDSQDSSGAATQNHQYSSFEPGTSPASKMAAWIRRRERPHNNQGYLRLAYPGIACSSCLPSPRFHWGSIHGIFARNSVTTKSRSGRVRRAAERSSRRLRSTAMDRLDLLRQPRALRCPTAPRDRRVPMHRLAKDARAPGCRSAGRALWSPALNARAFRAQRSPLPLRAD